MPRATRRRFVRNTTLAAAGLVTTGIAGAGGRDPTKVRVALIGRTGKGDYGHALDVAFTKLPNVEIVALADESEVGRKAAQKRTGAKKTYADFQDMLATERVDIVGICPRWIDQHHDMILAAAQAGAHVYMEKPFCRNLAECDSAIRELEKKNLKLGIAHISQYSPVLDVVVKLIQQGEIGELLELRGRGKEDRRGGGEDLWVLGSHVFGLMRSLAGADAVACTARVTRDGHPITRADVMEGAEGIGPLAGDHIQAHYEFPDGVSGYFASRRNVAGNPTRFAVQVFGSKGIIDIESGFGAKAYLLKDSSWSPGRSGKGTWKTITSAGIDQPEPRDDAHYEGGHVAAIRDLIDCMQHDRKTRCSAEDSRSIIGMIAAVFESQRVGGRVDLPLKTRVNPLTLLS
jgi:predicted dehydrogenase